MRTLVVNAVFVLPGRIGGAEHMAYSLIRGLAEEAPSDLRIVVLTAAERDGSPAFAERVDGVDYVAVRWRADNRFLTETLAFSRRRPVDAVLNLNYFDPPTVRAGRTVTIIHDAQFRHLPMYFSGAKRAWMRLAHTAALATSDTVVVPSRFVADHLRSVHRRARAEVSVVGNPIEWDRFDAAPGGARPSGRQPYVLAATAAYPHKNLATLIEAFDRYRRDGGTLDLRLTGQSAANLRSTRDIGPTGRVDGLVEHGFVSAHERTALMAGCEALMFPSLYEGYGLPPVEALGMGRPVVTTACASIPEVTLGRALYVPAATDVHAWVDALHKVEKGGVPAPSAADVADVRAASDHRAVGARMLGIVLGTS